MRHRAQPNEPDDGSWLVVFKEVVQEQASRLTLQSNISSEKLQVLESEDIRTVR